VKLAHVGFHPLKEKSKAALAAIGITEVIEVKMPDLPTFHMSSEQLADAVAAFAATLPPADCALIEGDCLIAFPLMQWLYLKGITIVCPVHTGDEDGGETTFVALPSWHEVTT